MLELFVMLPAGSLIVFLGWQIWKKERITLIHDYHYTKVTEENKKPYTKRMGQATLLMGVGMLLTCLIDWLFKTSAGWFVFGVTFIGGLIIMVAAQIKYNHGIF